MSGLGSCRTLGDRKATSATEVGRENLSQFRPRESEPGLLPPRPSIELLMTPHSNVTVYRIQPHASFLFNFNPLLPSGETQSQALIVSSFTDHGEAQEENLQSLHKPHTGVQTKAVTGG